MGADVPIPAMWDGEVFRPTGPYSARQADKQYVVGQVYKIEARTERSTASHAHYFAAIKEVWDNLPDAKREQYPSTEHLRKWALIKAGYRDEQHIDCGRADVAERVAAGARALDTFAVIVARKSMVSIYTARSQSSRHMDAKDFAASKQAVLDVLAQLIGVSVDDLRKNAGQAA